MDILVDEALDGQCVRCVLQNELKLSTKMIKSQSAGFPPPTLGVYKNTATFLLVLL